MNVLSIVFWRLVLIVPFFVTVNMVLLLFFLGGDYRHMKPFERFFDFVEDKANLKL